MAKINTLEFAKLMQTQLDQQMVAELTSGWMEANAGQVKYSGGDEVKIPTMSTSGLANYDRDNGFVQGGITLKYDTYKMTQDRGRTFQLDAMDVDESNFVATSANAIKVFQQEKVAPEIDAYRYSKIHSIANTASQTESIDLTADNALKKMLEHIAAVEDVVGEGRELVISMTSQMRNLILDDPKISKYISVADFQQGKITLKVKTINDNCFIKIVPSARFMTLYDVKDGKTSGQEAGGLTPNASAKKINYLITPKNVPLAISKTDKLRIFEPGVNQKADAWKIDYRKYHDLWIKKQQEKTIFSCISAK